MNHMQIKIKIKHQKNLLTCAIRFRQEYKRERKVLAELDLDERSGHLLNHDDDLSQILFSPSKNNNNNNEVNKDPHQYQYQSEDRHNISRVVLLHNDKIQTLDQGSADDFFDNDSFWSGSMTWY